MTDTRLEIVERKLSKILEEFADATTIKAINSAAGDFRSTLRKNSNGLFSSKKVIKAHLSPLLEKFNRIISSSGPDSQRGAKANAKAHKCEQAVVLLRSLIQVIAPRLTWKRCQAIVECLVSACCDGADKTLSGAVALDCLKAVNEILTIRPLLDRMDHKLWVYLSKFALRTTKEVTGWRKGNADDARPAATLDQRASRSHRHIAAQSIRLLSLLTLPPATSFIDLGESFLSALMYFLTKDGPIDSTESEAVSGLYFLISRLCTEAVKLTQEMTPALVDLVMRVWGRVRQQSQSVRDDLLGILILLLPFIESLVDSKGSAVLVSTLDDLRESIIQFYQSRIDKEAAMLQLIDINLRKSDHIDGTRFPHFSLRKARRNSWSNWSMLTITARLLKLCVKSPPPDLGRSMLGPSSVKKPRRAEPLDELKRMVRMPQFASTLTGLQVIAIYGQLHTMEDQEALSLVQFLTDFVQQDDLTVVSWAFLAITSCARAGSLMAGEGRDLLIRLCTAARRAANVAGTCRSACHYLVVAFDSGLLDGKAKYDLSTNALDTLDIQGPAVVDDSSVEYVRRVLHFCQVNRPSTFPIIASHAISWTFRTWDPGSRIDDGEVILLENVLNLAAASVVLPPVVVKDLLFHTTEPHEDDAWTRQARAKELIAYILDQKPPSDPKASNGSFFGLHYRANMSDSAKAKPTERLFECLVRDVDIRLQEARSQSHLDDAKAHQGVQGTRASAVLLRVVFWALANCKCANFTSTQVLQKKTDDLLSIIMMEHAKEGQITAGTELAIQVLFTATGTHEDMATRTGFRADSTVKWQAQLLPLARKMEGQAWQALSAESQGMDEDMMDIDSSQMDSTVRTQSNESQKSLHITEPATSTSPQWLRALFYGQILAMQRSPGQNQESSSALREELRVMQPADYLACADMLLLMPSLGVNLDEIMLTDVLFGLGGLFQSYELGSSLATGLLLLRVLSHTLNRWIDTNNIELSGSVVDIIQAFAAGVLRNNLHEDVQVVFSDLLIQIWQRDEDFGRQVPHESDITPPSVRTVLFNLVKSGSVLLRFHLATRVHTVFSFFTTANHSALFDDLRANLPSRFDCTEDMALHVLFLASLASKWQTLLRQAVYYSVELVGRASLCSPFAVHGMLSVAEAQSFTSPKSIFRVFCPQLVHTWLKDRKVMDIPYEVFSFDSVGQLIEDNLGEVVAQCYMSGREDDLQAVQACLNIDKAQVIHDAFPEVLAYSIAHDVSHENRTLEDGIIATFSSGTEYAAKVKDNLPQVLAKLFHIVIYDGGSEKSLESYKMQKALETLKETKSFCCSQEWQSLTMEPCFRGKHLLSSIVRVSRRASQTLPKVLHGPMFVSLIRSLFTATHPALGSAHTQTILVKVRFLCAMMSEELACRYPAEMLLLAIRPLLLDSRCVDDAVGLIWLIYEKGRPAFVQDFGGLFGSLLQTVTAAKLGAILPHDDLTQETQRRQTITNLDKLRTWLVSYCSELDQSLSDRSRSRLSRMVQSCSDISYPAILDNDTAATLFLLCLIEDAKMTNSLLSEDDRIAAIQSLLLHASDAHGVHKAFLTGSQRDISLVWSAFSTLDGEIPASIKIWLGQLIGASWNLDRQLIARTHQKITYARRGVKDIDTAVQGARSHISQALQQCLRSEALYRASTAEDALRQIIQAFSQVKDMASVELALPEYIVRALDLFPVPAIESQSFSMASAVADPVFQSQTNPGQWALQLGKDLVTEYPSEPMFSGLANMMKGSSRFLPQALPAMVHLLLVSPYLDTTASQEWLTDRLTHTLEARSPDLAACKEAIDLVIHLLDRPMTKDSKSENRHNRLGLVYIMVSRAALACGMAKTALYFAELATASETTSNAAVRSSRSSQTASISVVETASDLLLSIFDSIDEPDAYYSLDRPPTISNILQTIDRREEHVGALLFNSARVDAATRSAVSSGNLLNLVSALSNLQIDSLTQSLVESAAAADTGASAAVASSAERLYQWDLPPFSEMTAKTCVYDSLRNLANATSRDSVKAGLMSSISGAVDMMKGSDIVFGTQEDIAGLLATLQSIFDLSDCRGLERTRILQHNLASAAGRWKLLGSNALADLIRHQETMFGILRRNSALHQDMSLSIKECLLLEVKAVMHTAATTRTISNAPGSLTTATYLTDLIDVCSSNDLRISAAANMEMATVLWDQKEPQLSVRLLQQLSEDTSIEKQDIPVGRAGVLAQLGSETATARLERPEEVISRYLRPALQAITKHTDATEVAKVYFEFAAFCDKQLQNPDSIADFTRLRKLRDAKLAERNQLETLLKNTPNTNKEARNELAKSLKKAKAWYQLDDQEFRKMQNARDDFMRQSLSNYLRALSVSDNYNTYAVRFFALWLEHEESEAANSAAADVISEVPSWKFVGLLTQMMSKMQANGSQFQATLIKLVSRICAEHPLHSIYQLFSSCHAAVAKTDTAGNARKTAATKIFEGLKKDVRARDLVQKVWDANILYHKLATTKVDASKTTRFNLKQIPAAMAMNKAVSELQIPPATLHLDIRPGADYRSVPIIVRFRDDVSIASGLSAPKVLTARASDGLYYKQLFKGGNDDLRQDAIMEQVFTSVSSTLRNHSATRRRNLGIRTYIVLPLTSISGIMEFVPNSIPLHDFLAPAHQTYHTSDLKWGKAREGIRAAEGSTREQRLTAYRNVCKQYNPVMRYFFFERFIQPDDWFAKRLAYSRSTAAISILGHVLGLGDRHCHNILLDELTGEAVHIDLGVAFEAGRVLPVPEVVPFRLTRDIVDGMGVTGVEGVFRRCCEAVLEALRGEKDSIMTLLNVLRYDPLYSWTVSPLRARKMQTAAAAAAAAAAASEVNGGDPAAPPPTPDGTAGAMHAVVQMQTTSDEAERALAVVEKKLSPALSPSAAVNELIQTASDERNLAVLFAGWSAFS